MVLVFFKESLNALLQAEEEFNKTQTVFEEINNEMREELPVLYQRYVWPCGILFINFNTRVGLKNPVWVLL